MSKRKNIVFTVTAIGLFCVLGLSIGLTLFSIRSSKKPFSPPSPSHLGKYKTAAVSSDGIPCSEVGRDVLKDGGNAMDAAIAALFCIGVSNPQSAGIGGGFLMTIYDTKTGKASCLDARETAPGAATEDMFNGNSSLSQKGGLAVAVPGELAGYWAAHQRYGSLPWSRLVLPAIDLAANGIAVNWALASSLAGNEATIKSEPSLRPFLNEKTGRVWKAGEVYKRPVLAATLRSLAQEGIDTFYNGTMGDKVVEDVTKKGGILTKEDLMNYRIKWVAPVKVQLNDELIMYSIPPPGSGVLTAYILNILDAFLLQDSTGKDPLTYHRIAEAFKYAYAQRTKLADPDFAPEVEELARNLTSEALAAETRAKINDSFTSNDPQYYGAVTYTPDDKGTSHVSVLDGEGLAVSVTSTINLHFGAGFASEQTDIIMNDEMDDFSSPSVISYFGLPPSPANFIRPGKRPLSSMTPTIIVNSTSGRVRSVIGAAGGTKITTSTAYAIIRNLWFGETIKEAVDSDRIHHQLFPMELQHEPGFPTTILDSLAEKGHNFSTFSNSSAVCGIVVEPSDGFIYANSDYRKGGDVAGIDPLD